MNTNEKNTLLKLARDTINEYLKSGTVIKTPPAQGVLGEVCGAFVTLHKGDDLRGCIGNMIGRGPLVETIRDMAIAAATEDPRFETVRLNEMKDISIEISVLTPMRRIKDVSEIEVGKHGILMKRGYNQGVLLPQVATEWKWNREEFLKHTCMKAGLPEDAWKSPDTIIEIFSAEVFGEKAFHDGAKSG